MKVEAERRIKKLVLGGWVAAFVLWVVCACVGGAGQRKLFFEEGRQELFDFWMPRMCLEQGYQGGPELSDWHETADGPRFVTGTFDKVYPALALMPFKAFPATRTGGWCWSVLAGLAYLVSLVLITDRREKPCAAWGPLLAVCSMPFIFNLERGNPVWLSAALCGVFLAWWDDPRAGRRVTAACCLATATVLKIAPVVLGLLYVREIVSCLRAGDRAGGLRAVRLALLAAGVAAVLFAVPWLFLPEGFSAVSSMIQNAANHANLGLRMGDFGLVPVWRTIRVALGQDVSAAWPGMMAVARLSQILGFMALAVGVMRRRPLLLVGGMLLAAGNMFYYAALYLVPALVLEWRSLDGKRLLLWFLLLCPLQIVLLGHSGNGALCNLCLLVLMALEARQ